VAITNLEDLRRYDPEVIAAYYRRRPFTVVARALGVSLVLLYFAFELWWDRLRGREVANRMCRAAQLRTILTDLGPGPIKIGQALSTRPDLLPKDYMEELTKLQDRLPPSDNGVAFERIRLELGRPARDIFAHIDSVPVAAASLGQVYKARLRTGETVAVKVQRPNLVNRISLDLLLLRWFSLRFGGILPLNLGHDLTLIVDEFGTKLFEEIDYEQEAANCERFAGYFEGDPNVYVPKIYREYSSRRVLTLEWIDGIKLTDIAGVRAAGLDINSLIRIGVEAGLRQLLEYGFFHADPHPGNLFALRDGRMAYIDFGMMDQLDEDTKETLVDSLVHLINREYLALAEDYVRLGFLAPGTDLRPIVPALESVLGEIMGQKVGEFNFKTITDKFSDLVYEYPFRVPAKFALIIRSLITQEGIALSLTPDFKIVEVAYPYVARRLLTGESPRLRQRLLEVLFKGGRFQWHRLENLIRIASTGGGNLDLMPAAQLGLQSLLSSDGRFLREKLVQALTEDDRLHLQEISRLWDLVRPSIRPRELVTSALANLRERFTSNGNSQADVPEQTALARR
jgi:predicted unusual protein kinase regulating ubiquinone biosynthesis (AarF/ABC1/UbiB family)